MTIAAAALLSPSPAPAANGPAPDAGAPADADTGFGANLDAALGSGQTTATAAPVAAPQLPMDAPLILQSAETAGLDGFQPTTGTAEPEPQVPGQTAQPTAGGTKSPAHPAGQDPTGGPATTPELLAALEAAVGEDAPTPPAAETAEEGAPAKPGAQDKQGADGAADAPRATEAQVQPGAIPLAAVPAQPPIETAASAAPSPDKDTKSVHATVESRREASTKTAHPAANDTQANADFGDHLARNHAAAASGSAGNAAPLDSGKGMREASELAAAPAPPAHEPVVSGRPGEIGRDMGLAIAKRVTAGGEELTVRLDPAHMGKIEVRMSFDDRGSLRAVVSAEHASSLELLRRDSADLSRAMADAGIRADQQSFRFDSRSSGGEAGNFWQRQQQRSTGGTGGTADGDGTPIGTEADYRPLRAVGRVDLMA